jgi:hypothetical protein
MALLGLLSAAHAWAHDPPQNGCGSSTGDSAHEIAVMQSPAVNATAHADASGRPPRLALDQHYAINLVAQEALRFRVKPARAARATAPRGGVFEFDVPATGRYRVSITSRHWIDIIDGETAIPSVDHFGPGCELVHKIVEFDLSAGRPLTLQLSGQDDAIIGLAITAAPAPVAPPAQTP